MYIYIYLDMGFVYWLNAHVHVYIYIYTCIYIYFILCIQHATYTKKITLVLLCTISCYPSKPENWNLLWMP